MSVISIKQTIRMPKNRVTLMTLDKDGQILRKRDPQTNTWTSSGYEHILLNSGSGRTLIGLQAPTTNTSGNDAAEVFISAGTTPITITSSNLTNSSRQLSSTTVTTLDGTRYPRVVEETINGTAYIRITYAKSFPFGAVTVPVGQVGMRFRGNISSDPISCGMRVEDANGDSDPFVVTQDEQLVVMYDIYFLRSDVHVAETDGSTAYRNIGTINYDVNGAGENFIEATVDHLSLFSLTGTGTAQRTMLFNAMGREYGNSNLRVNGSNEPGANYTLTGWGTNDVIRSNNNRTAKREVTLLFPPSPKGAGTFNNINFPYDNLRLVFNPPIVKSEVDRVRLTIHYEVTIDEIDF